MPPWFWAAGRSTAPGGISPGKPSEQAKDGLLAAVPRNVQHLDRIDARGVEGGDRASGQRRSPLHFSSSGVLS